MTEGKEVRAVERHIQVARRARYWELGGAIERPSQVWFALHGYKQLAARFIRRFHTIDDGTRRIIAPEALSRFYIGQEPGRHGPTSVVGATWMTREDRENEIADYVGYLDALARDRGEAAGHTTVLGFSQGVATAARWTVLGEFKPDRLILWGDALPPDLDLALAKDAWAGIDIVLVRGRADRAISSALAERERGQLDQIGLPVRVLEYEGGHDIDVPTLERLAAE